MEYANKEDGIRAFLAYGQNDTPEVRAALGEIATDALGWSYVKTLVDFNKAMATYFPLDVQPGKKGRRLSDQVADVIDHWVTSNTYNPVPSLAQLAVIRWTLLTDPRRDNVERAHSILVSVVMTNFNSTISMADREYLEYAQRVLFNTNKEHPTDHNFGELLRLAVETDLARRAAFRKKISLYKNHALIEQGDIPVDDEVVIPSDEKLPTGYKFVETIETDRQMLKRGKALIVSRLRPAIAELEKKLLVELNREESALLREELNELLEEEQMLIANWKRTQRAEQSILNDPFLKDVINSTKRTRDEDTTYKRKLFLEQLQHTGQMAPRPEDYEHLKNKRRMTRDVYYTDTSSLDLPDQVAPILPVDAYAPEGVRTRFGRILE